MGKNISIYLTDDVLEWLDRLCEIWDMGRSQAIQFLLITMKQWLKASILMYIAYEKLYEYRKKVDS